MQVEREQINIEETKAVGKSFADSVKTIMAGNAIIGMVFAGVLQYLWGMVNTLQVINLAIIYDCLLPENMLVILSEVNKACNFDFYNTENLYIKMFGFEDTESFSPKFEEAGFEGSNFIISIGPIFIFIVLFPMFLLIRALVGRTCAKQCSLKCCQSTFVHEIAYLPIFITFMLESCIGIGFSCAICIKFVSLRITDILHLLRV